jgi:hypothetical protein
MRSVMVSDDDLARARRDPAFRQQLLAESLEMLISELTRLRNGTASTQQLRQIREGGSLAVQLAELLQKLESGNSSEPAA